MNLQELKTDCALKQKKGLHFILASVIIWGCIAIVYATNLPILTKNLLAFCCTAPLMPIALLVSKIIKVDFQNKQNPLSSLGLLFSLNQLLYILIAMWVFSAVPEKMLMVFAMIFGAHLMPFSWLYSSKSYLILSIAIPIASLLIGLYFEPLVLALTMLGVEVLFCVCLWRENRTLHT